MPTPYAYLKDPLTGRYIDKTETDWDIKWVMSVEDPMAYPRKCIKLTKEWCELQRLAPYIEQLNELAWLTWYEIREEELHFEPYWDWQVARDLRGDIEAWRDNINTTLDQIHLLTREHRLWGFVAFQWTPKVKWVQTYGKGLSPELITEIKIQERWQRKGNVPRIEGIQRSQHEKEVIEMALNQGVYGYFKNRMTSSSRWKTMDAESLEDYEYRLKKIREEEKAIRAEWEDDFWDLKKEAMKDYVEISIPAFTDVVRVPNSQAGTPEERKARKRQLYEHMLHSPIPRTAMKLQRIAKCTDDIEDYASTGAAMAYFGTKALTKWSPYFAKKIGTKAIPGLGWVLLGTDILNLATGLFSAAANPMGAKRLFESAANLSRRRGLAKLLSKERAAHWKPTVGTLLEALQASEDLTGYGIRLGPIMGTISETFWAHEKILTGEVSEIKFSYPWDKPGSYEEAAYKAMGSAGELLPHLAKCPNPATIMTVVLIGIAAKKGWIKSFHPQWDLVYEAIKDMQLIYHPPTNPETREVLTEMGYDPDENVGYLGMEWGEMPFVRDLGWIGEWYEVDLINEILMMFKDSWMGYFLNCEIDDCTDSFLAMLAYPDSGLVYHRTGYADILMITAKMGVIPPLDTPAQVLQIYCDFIIDYIKTYEKWPNAYQLKTWATNIMGGFDTTTPPTKVYMP